MDGNALLTPPMIKVTTTEESAKLAELNKKLAPVENRIKEEAAKIKYAEPPNRPKPATNATDFVWVEDNFPEGAKAQINGGTVEVRWIEGTNVYSGKRALARTDRGVAQDFFLGATNP